MRSDGCGRRVSQTLISLSPADQRVGREHDGEYDSKHDDECDGEYDGEHDKR